MGVAQELVLRGRKVSASQCEEVRKLEFGEAKLAAMTQGLCKEIF